MFNLLTKNPGSTPDRDNIKHILKKHASLEPQTIVIAYDTDTIYTLI